jgi:hypothetical protein
MVKGDAIYPYDDDAVVLHVYDLSEGAASRYSTTMLNKHIGGIWHTGVVVFGLEFFFGGGIQCMYVSVVTQCMTMPNWSARLDAPSMRPI